jgi:hypothetical protein
VGESTKNVKPRGKFTVQNFDGSTPIKPYFGCYMVLFPSINPSYFGVNTRGTGELSHPHLNKLQEMLKTGPGIISAKEIPARKIVGEIHCGVRKVMSIGRTTGPPPHTNIPGSCQSNKWVCLNMGYAPKFDG